ncbi:major facilitator superfamily transporter [Cladorrhinum sp. PSN259]|nr:major facilitator superfamily transporter [Cladorrhinum sp. PSN259]
MQNLQLPEPAIPPFEQSSAEQPSAEQPSIKDASLAKARYISLMIAIATGLFLSLLDASVVATALFNISVDLRETERINWVALSYTLAYLGFTAFLARITDVVGRKMAFVASYVIFVAFSLGCGFSRTLEELIICRAFQGLGGSGLYSITMVMLPEILPYSKKKLVSSTVGLVIAAAAVMGPILGGVLTQYATWRWIFWINGPIGTVSLALFYLAWPKDKHAFSPRLRWRDLDYLGSFLLLTAAVLLVFPFQHLSYLLSVPEQELNDSTVSAGEHRALLKSPYFQASFTYTLATAFIVLVLFVSWNHFASLYRCTAHLAFAFPRSLLRNRVYIAVFLNTLMVGFPYLTCVYAFPIRFQVVYGKSPLQAGLMLLPMLGASAVATVVAGAVNARQGQKNRFCETMTAACLFMLLGCGLEIITTDKNYVRKVASSVGFLAFVGFGFGLSASAGTMLVAVESEVRDHATAQGLLAQVRILGGSIGIAVSSALLAAKARDIMGPGALNPEMLAHVNHTGTTISAEQWMMIGSIYTEAIRDDMVICCAVLGVGALCSLTIYRRHRLPVDEIMRQRLKHEADRQQALARLGLGTASTVQMEVVTPARLVVRRSAC